MIRHVIHMIFVRRVIAADVMAAIEAGAVGGASGAGSAPAGVAGQDYMEIKHSSVRKVIAKRLLGMVPV